MHIQFGARGRASFQGISQILELAEISSSDSALHIAARRDATRRTRLRLAMRLVSSGAFLRYTTLVV